MMNKLKNNQVLYVFMFTKIFNDNISMTNSWVIKWENKLQVTVRDNNVDQALKALKKKMQREGIFREMKLRNHYEKPSVKKAREKAEAIRRGRKLARKKLMRDGSGIF